MIRFGPEVCTRLEESLPLEWIETNGLGGFASSTVSGMNSRRYHGLLVAATKPPVGRLVLLSKFEETLIIGDRRYELSANRYPGVVYPEGFKHLIEFRLDPFPRSIFRVDGIELEKRVWMVQGENTVVVEYELLTHSASCELELRPLVAFRDYHSTSHQNGALNPHVDQANQLASFCPYDGSPRLYFAHNAVALETSGSWYNNFEYDHERERGLDFQEDLFQPFVLRFALSTGAPATVIASTQPHLPAEAPEMRAAEIARRAAIVDAAPSPEPIVKTLTAAADQYIAKRGELKTVIAGYHWFSDWGRDTMIALPGLTLVTGRLEIARMILEAFARSVDRGMLPNLFPDAGDIPEYNTVDATLWFFEAIRSYLRYSGDVEVVRERFYPVLRDILQWHLDGTRYGIHADSDGLLACGEPGVQLTWMDAKIGDWVVTPRTGKPVEIQALWYNALRILENFAHQFGDPVEEATARSLADRARDSFRAKFWNHHAGCLYDVVDEMDGAVRPNQVFAISLPHTMLESDQARQVLDVVERDLLTPIGLRSLSPADSRYRPHYGGGVWDRDSAYHQGTIWPWLMGPYLTAYLKVHGATPDARAKAKAWLEGFQAHLETAGLGQISEIADAEPPFTPRGCVAQAWSIAELLRAAVEDVYASEPAAMRAVQMA